MRRTRRTREKVRVKVRLRIHYMHFQRNIKITKPLFFLSSGLRADSDAPEEVSNQTMIGVFQFFSDFAIMIVDSVQTQEFPFGKTSQHF